MPKILHFEDDTFLRSMYQAKFEQLGFDCAGYDSPTLDPVPLVLKEKPDLIIMDIIMPISDGFTATQQLKADKRTKVIPIFGLCNLAQKQDIERAKAVGMTEYWVTANHMPGEVVNKVYEILGLPIPPEKPVPPRGDAWHGQSVGDPPPDKPKSWWHKLFG